MINENRRDVYVFSSAFYKKLTGGKEDDKVGPMTQEVSKIQHDRVRYTFFFCKKHKVSSEPRWF